MKIAITAKGKDLSSPVDERFGRAEFFIIYDTETGEFQVIDNTPNLQAMQGAGVQSAQKIIELGAEVVLTGHCGPKAFQVLTAGGVKVCAEARGTVQEAIDAYLKGELKPSSAPDVNSHW